MGRFRQSLRRACEAVIPQSWMMFHGQPELRAVALTFDDGPHPTNTPPLLDELSRLGIRATFFVIGECARQRPDLVKRIVAEGHCLGHHTWSHTNPRSTSVFKLAEEVTRTQLYLESLTGRPCRLFRPPQGHLTLAKTLALWSQWQTIVLWNVDSSDCRVGSVALAADWARSWEPRSGDVVLLHDDMPFAADLVDPLAAQVDLAGLRFVTIEAMLKNTMAALKGRVSVMK